MTERQATDDAPRPCRHPHASATRVDDDLVVYHATSDRYLVLNHTAADIWEALDGTLTLDEVAALLAERYGVDPTLVRDEAEQFVALLAEKGLLQEPAAPPPAGEPAPRP